MCALDFEVKNNELKKMVTNIDYMYDHNSTIELYEFLQVMTGNMGDKGTCDDIESLIMCTVVNIITCPAAISFYVTWLILLMQADPSAAHLLEGTRGQPR